MCKPFECTLLCVPNEATYNALNSEVHNSRCVWVHCVISILLFLATAWMHCDIDTVATVTALFRLLFARSSCLLS